MNSHLLTLLANHLDKNVEEHEFSLKHWKSRTTACAIGHAMDIPEIEEGFNLDCRKVDNCTPIIPVLETPEGEVFSEWDAVMKLFDITYHEAIYLFLHSAYISPTRDNVIKRIREFVAEKEEIKADIVAG